jgi:dihydrofolate reductase
MRKVILQLAVSLDGYIEGPNGEYDWCFTDQDYGMKEFYTRIDSMFIGRKSYELMMTMDESVMPGFPKLTEYVFSTTLQEVKPGAILIRENMEAEVSRIKNEPGKDIWLFGGASLSSALLNHNLVDEMILAVHPILLGQGKPLAADIKRRIPLTLTGSKVYTSGLVMLNYDLENKDRVK